MSTANREYYFALKYKIFGPGVCQSDDILMQLFFFLNLSLVPMVVETYAERRSHRHFIQRLAVLVSKKDYTLPAFLRGCSQLLQQTPGYLTPCHYSFFSYNS